MLQLLKKGLIEDRIFEVAASNDTCVNIVTTFKDGDVEIHAAVVVKIDVWERAVERYLFSEHYKKDKQ